MSAGMFDGPPVVRRAKDGRPYILSPCPEATEPYASNQPSAPWPAEAREHVWSVDPLVCFVGRVKGARAGTDKQCPTCKGKGFLETLYTRCTTFVNALEDTTNLQKWRERMVLSGLVASPALLDEIRALDLAEIDAAYDPTDTFGMNARQTLEAIGESAFEAAEGRLAAQRGTNLHKLREYVDRGERLPETLEQEDHSEHQVTLQDRADMAAYYRVTRALGMVVLHSEIFVVNDQYKIAGTADALAAMGHPGEICKLCTDPTVVDLKTGRVDYGAGKIAQQVAIYANSQRYNVETGERTELGACKHKGLIIHLPQGTGEATVLSVDLEAGYGGVELSWQARQYRNASKKWLAPLDLRV